MQTSLLQAPFVVAVTGHRDPLAPDELSQTLTAQLTTLRVEAEKLGAKNFLLLSGLATGADTLAARAAIDLGWQVIAPLPLPLDEYRTDFTDGAEREEFEALLKLCPHHFFIGYAPDCDEHNTREQNSEGRNRQYAFLGEFLVRHCEVLIACWDGEDAGGVGGTGDVVQMQLVGIPAHLCEMRRDGSLLDAPEGGRAIQIWTGREGHKKKGLTLPKGKARGQVEELHWHDGNIVRAPESHHAATRAHSAENEQREKRRRAWNAFVAEMNELKETPDDTHKQLPEKLVQSEYLRRVRDAHLRADELAQGLQQEVERNFETLMVIGVGFTLCVSVASAWESQRWSVGVLVLTWGLLATWKLVSWRSAKTDAATRHQDYRALAEAWRIAFFWRVVGIHDALDASYFRYQRGELDWIRQALRTADLRWRAAQNGYPTEMPGDAFQTTIRVWVKGQTNYFRNNKVFKDRQKLTKLRNYSWAFLALGLCASAVEAVAHSSVNGAFESAGAALLWQFTIHFVSADLLSSPLLPAALLLGRMEKWPYATDDNTRVDAQTGDVTSRRRKLRLWFERQEARHRLRLVAIVLGATTLAAALYVGGLSAPAVRPVAHLVATICFFLPTLVYIYAEFLGLPKDVERYERALKIFERAQQMLERLPDSWKPAKREAQQRRILRELGREALHENGEWLLANRERPLDIEP